MKNLLFLLILSLLGVFSSTAAVAIDKNDTIYVSSLGATTRDSGFILRIDKYDSNGKESAEVTEVITSKENEPIGAIRSMAFNSHNDLYIADSSRRQILKLNIGSNIVTESEASGTGTFYENNAGVKVKRITDSSVEVIVNQLHEEGMGGDGFEAINATLLRPNIIVFDREDNLYISDSIITSTAYRGDTINEATNDTGDSSYSDFLLKEAETALSNRIRVVEGGKPEGKITLFAGTGLEKYSGDGNTALSTNIGYPGAMIVGNDGEFYVSSFKENKFLKIHNIIPKQNKKQYVEGDEHYSFPQIFNGEIAVPSEDGNFMFIFDKKGRHDRTVNLVKNHLEYKFKYGEYENQNGNGDKKVWYLNEIIKCDYSRMKEEEGKPSCDGDTVSITRESNTGVASKITASNGEITTLSIVNNIMDKITVYNNINYVFTYEDGLMTTYRNSDQYEYQYVYGNQADKKGLLEKIFKPNISEPTTYIRTGNNDSYTLIITSPEGVEGKQEVKRSISSNNHVEIKTTYGASTQNNYFETYTESIPKKMILQDDGTEIYVVDTDYNLMKVTKGSLGNEFSVFLGKHPDKRIGMLAPTECIEVEKFDDIIISESYNDYTLNIDKNGINHLTKIKDEVPGVSKEEYEYNLDTNIETSKSFIFDSSYKLTNKETKEFNRNGKLNKTTIWNNGSVDTVYNFDENENISSITKGLRTIEFIRDSNGNVKLTRTSAGETKFTYDSNNQLNSINNTNLNISNEGYLEGVANNTYGRNAIGQLTSGNYYTYKYNNDFQPKEEKAGNYVTTSIYDDNGHLKTKSLNYNGVTDNIGYFYDGDIVPDNSDNNLNMVKLNCNPITQTCIENYSGFKNTEIESKINNNGLESSYEIKVAGTSKGLVEFKFNEKGEIEKSGDINFTQIGRNTEATIESHSCVDNNCILLGTSNSDIERNEQDEVIKYNVKYNELPVYDGTYTRDESSRLVEKTEIIDNKRIETYYRYGFDDNHRLESELVISKDLSIENSEEITDYHREYTYHDNGKLKGVNTYHNGLNLIEATYINEQLAVLDKFYYGYDDAGNVKKITNTTDPEREIQTNLNYDSMGMLSDVLIVAYNPPIEENGSPKVISLIEIVYDNDSLGRRLSKNVRKYTCTEDQDESTCRIPANKISGYSDGYQYSGESNKPIARYVNGEFVESYIYGENSFAPSYIDRGDTRYRIVSDNNGSVRLVLDMTNGKIMEKHNYTAYGKIIEEHEFVEPGWDPITFSFKGGLKDQETGFINFGSRDLNPQMEISIQPSRRISLVDNNLYGLFRADPVNITSPDGNKLVMVTNGFTQRARDAAPWIAGFGTVAYIASGATRAPNIVVQLAGLAVLGIATYGISVLSADTADMITMSRNRSITNFSFDEGFTTRYNITDEEYYNKAGAFGFDIFAIGAGKHLHNRYSRYKAKAFRKKMISKMKRRASIRRIKKTLRNRRLTNRSFVRSKRINSSEYSGNSKTLFFKEFKTYEFDNMIIDLKARLGVASTNNEAIIVAKAMNIRSYKQYQDFIVHRRGIFDDVTGLLRKGMHFNDSFIALLERISTPQHNWLEVSSSGKRIWFDEVTTFTNRINKTGKILYRERNGIKQYQMPRPVDGDVPKIFQNSILYGSATAMENSTTTLNGVKSMYPVDWNLRIIVNAIISVIHKHGGIRLAEFKAKQSAASKGKYNESISGWYYDFNTNRNIKIEIYIDNGIITSDYPSWIQ